MKANQTIRDYAKRNNIFLWQIANRLGVSEPTMNRWLRTPLAPEKEQSIMAAIVELAKEAAGDA